MRKINTRNYRLATRATPREVNRRIVLNLIREHEPISRAELARRMKVRRASLTAIVRDLIAAGAVYESGPVAAVRGRRPTMIRVRTNGRLAVAVDIRPARTSLALADFSGEVLERGSFDTPADPEELVRRLVAQVSEMLAKRPAGDGAPAACEGIGVVVPGMVDRRSGKILYAPRLGWRDIALRDAIAAHLDIPVMVESAPIACASARLWLMTDAPRAVNNFAYVSISDGVGVSIVVSGEVLRGENHTAGELGHVSLDPNGPLCACGRRGCWEAFCCNSTTIARYLALAGDAPMKVVGAEAVASTIEEIIRRALDGEDAALNAITETGRQIGRGLAAVVSAFNPKRVYIGGEITAAWSLIEVPMRAALVEGTLTDAARATPVHADQNPAEYRIRGAVAVVAAPSYAALRVG